MMVEQIEFYREIKLSLFQKRGDLFHARSSIGKECLIYTGKLVNGGNIARGRLQLQ